MFKQIFSWFRKKVTTLSGEEAQTKKEVTPEEEEDSDYRFDVYMPGERLVYCYWDGENLKRVDPMTLYKKVMTRGTELLDAFKPGTPEEVASNHDKRVKAIKEIFVVKSFDEGGLSELEMVEMFDHFMDYCLLIRKDAPYMAPTQPPRTNPNTPPEPPRGPVEPGNYPIPHATPPEGTSLPTQ